jgi:Sulfotransferase family
MYAFVHIEKTGGTTLHSILRRSFGTRHCDIRLPLAKRTADKHDFRPHVDAADLRRARRLYRNLRGISGHIVRAYADLHQECLEIQFFTWLREPLSRYRSHFLNRGVRYNRADFDRWFSDSRHHNWQSKIIAGEPSGEKAIEMLATRFGMVGLMEQFDESLLLLGDWLCDREFRPEYRRLNQLAEKRRPCDIAREKSDTSYLETDEVRDQIREANAEDLKLYDYVTQVVYPRQVAAYDGDLAADLEGLRERNRQSERLVEPGWSSFIRNYVYKPLLHCHVV